METMALSMKRWLEMILMIWRINLKLWKQHQIGKNWVKPYQSCGIKNKWTKNLKKNVLNLLLIHHGTLNNGINLSFILNFWMKKDRLMKSNFIKQCSVSNNKNMIKHWNSLINVDFTLIRESPHFWTNLIQEVIIY